METLVFHRVDSRTVMLMQADWPREVELAAELLDVTDPFLIDEGDGIISFSVANGCAWYECIRMRGVYGISKVYTYRLLHGFLGIDP